MKIVLFCHPGESYKGLPEEEVARNYTEMASDDFDEMIRFEQDYENNFVLEPDYIKEVSQKGDKTITLTVFAYQPVIRVKEDDVSIISSSNLFNPECHFKKEDGEELYLPDLEVIQIAGSQRDVNKMVKAVRDLYSEKNGWNVKEEIDKIKRIVVQANPKRFSKPIEILDPEMVIDIASEKAGYSPYRLYF